MTYKVRRKLFHALTVIFLLAIVTLGIVRNPHVIWRFWESVRDFFLSLAALFCLPVKVTSSTLPVKLAEGFPRALAQLWEMTKQVGTQFFDLYNFLSYLFLILQILTYSIYGITLLLLAVVLPFGISIYRSLKKYNNDYNRVSRPLKAFLKFKEKFRAVKNFLKRYVRFIKQCNYYRWTALIIVLFFTNLIPIALEVIAAYFAFIIDFDLGALGLQPVKLVYDVFLGIHFLPLWAWIPVVLAILGRWRRARGYKKLEDHEEEFRDFIKELRVAVMVCASMREGKTTFITAMMMSWEKIFREQAKDSMRRIEMKFPDFPFPVFERAMRSATRDHEIYDRRTARAFVEKIYSLHTKFGSDVAATRRLRKVLSKRYRVRFENILFGYDTRKHATFYDGGLGKESLEALLKTYAELYHIYTSKTSLIVSNYPIRLDDDLDDVGNFPKWEDDFFKKKPDDVQKSRLSHILNQDCLRLGTQENPDGDFNNAVQFAIFGMTEIGKERGNQFDKAGTKKDDPKPNQQNDLFNVNLKLFSNAATVDYFAYARFIADEQRAPNLGADARERATRFVTEKVTHRTKWRVNAFWRTNISICGMRG